MSNRFFAIGRSTRPPEESVALVTTAEVLAASLAPDGTPAAPIARHGMLSDPRQTLATRGARP
jgi:hypothetical protein